MDMSYFVYNDANSTALMSGKSNNQTKPWIANSQRNWNQNTQTDKKDLYCEFCHRTGHIQEKCFKLHGFPANYKPKGKKSHIGFQRGNNSGIGGHMVQQVTTNNLNSTSHAGNSANIDQSSSAQINNAAAPLHQPPQLTSDQIAQLLSLLNKPSTSTSESPFHLAVISYCLSVKHASNTWILDSGATDHITKSMSLLESPKLLTTPKSVHLPDGSIASVTHTGHVTLTSTIMLQNVLFIPSLHHNLLSISKLSCDSHCSINFTPTSCIMQGPMLKTPVVLGKQIDGLYCFDSSHDHFHSALSTSLNNIELWHHRLGHTSLDKLKCIVHYLSDLHIGDIKPLDCNNKHELKHKKRVQFKETKGFKFSFDIFDIKQ
ncbi:hypothetical protein BUALT_Bualt02G0020500 [Buddleja alternifolia]|uniref:GAG-pre-integrase domain-containing protein n=1 Tax=Buddleja alternifolia TaxID=168488 RepID=A0AAV6XY55_9LAMI|nr:hypothetical protein BUALT_Bualt02G0020500 [Buddleja alternifolia]